MILTSDQSHIPTTLVSNLAELERAHTITMLQIQSTLGGGNATMFEPPCPSVHQVQRSAVLAALAIVGPETSPNPCFSNPNTVNVGQNR